MQATETLKREHDVIERVLQLLEQAARALRLHKPLPDGFQSWAVEFIRHFADGCHHSKEEEVLFPLLEERGVPRQGGPIGVMLYEHEVGRDCVRRMSQTLPESGNDPAAFAAAAEEYVDLLRQHIRKENEVLFPMADAVLSPVDDADAVARFQTAAPERCACIHGQFEADVERWAAAFGQIRERSFTE